MLELFVTFFRIGLFTFGGGYAMIPLLRQEVVAHGWMDGETLIEYIAICESTPGPIAVNMATFIGASQQGLAGAAVATAGVVLPSFAVILAIAAALKQFRTNPYVSAALNGIHPAVAGMILATGLCVAMECICPKTGFDLRSTVIFALLIGAMTLWKRAVRRDFSPILLILLSAVLGMAFFGVK